MCTLLKRRQPTLVLADSIALMTVIGQHVINRHTLCISFFQHCEGGVFYAASTTCLMFFQRRLALFQVFKSILDDRCPTRLSSFSAAP